MESNKEIEARAAQWLLRRDSGPWTEEEAAGLEEWLERATAHRVVFLRLEAGLEEVNRLKALGAGFQRGVVPTVEELNSVVEPAFGPPESPRETPVLATPVSKDRGRVRIAAAVAFLAIATSTFAYLASPLAGKRYTTPVGGVTSVPLEDGSSVTLNTASSVRVHMTETERRIDLARGEAFFEVAKDASRPFVVRAGDKRVVAVGTKFSVRHEGGDVRVIVTEGKVAVTSPNDAVTLLSPGDLARAVDTRVAVESKVLTEAEELLSWRSGFLIFEDTKLAEAVAEFNRYNERQIVIDDPAIAGMRLTGKFRATNAETFVNLLEATFHVQARYADQRIVLSALDR